MDERGSRVGDREAAAIGAAEALVVEAAPLARAYDAQDRAVVVGHRRAVAIVVADQAVDLPAEQGIALVAEERGRGRVGERAAATRVHREDAVAGGLEE